MKEASRAVTTQDQPATTPAAPAENALERQLLEIATTPQERAVAFSMASAERQQRMLRLTAQAVAEEGWGKAISPVARQAVVRYCLEVGADPVRHVHVLGGNVYLNAAFWMDLVASNPKFIRAETAFIHDDDRADTQERERRKAQRLLLGVPEAAKGAAVVTLHYDGRGPFIGVNWAGAKSSDPVGTAEPTKTAETRAYRRAAMKAEPAWFRKHPKLEAAQELLVQGRELEKNGESLRPLGNTPVTTESIEVGAIGGGKQPTGVIENHEPDDICLLVGDHRREECGHFQKAATK
jgi:hypothetical protein